MRKQEFIKCIDSFMRTFRTTNANYEPIFRSQMKNLIKYIKNDVKNFDFINGYTDLLKIFLFTPIPMTKHIASTIILKILKLNDKKFDEWWSRLKSCMILSNKNLRNAAVNKKKPQESMHI